MRVALMLWAVLVVSVAAQPALEDRSIAVADASFHIRCGGERRANNPTVILEAGAGNDVGIWRDIHPSISEFARVCGYDRLGSGTSSDAPQGLAAADYPALLRRMLEAAGEPPPYILAGHSFGGVIVMDFANKYPTDVLGLVLIDSSHEDQLRRFATLPAPPAPRVSSAAAPMPMRRAVDQMGFVQALGREPWHGHIPVVVLTRSPASFSLNDAGAEARQALWLELQHDLATRSPRSQHVIAKKSGHFIQNEEPQIVIDAIRAVLRRITLAGHL